MDDPDVKTVDYGDGITLFFSRGLTVDDIPSHHRIMTGEHVRKMIELVEDRPGDSTTAWRCRADRIVDLDEWTRYGLLVDTHGHELHGIGEI